MKTKFIGLEGFNEIESLSTSKQRALKNKPAKLTATQKTVRFIKRASTLAVKSIKKNTVKATSYIGSKIINSAKTVKSKKTVSYIDRFYSESRTGNANSVREAITTIASTNGRKYAHITPKTGYRTHGVLKKRAVLTAVVCTSAILLSCMTVAGAVGTSNNATTVLATSKVNGAYIVTNSVSNSDHNSEDNCSLYSSTADEAVKSVRDDAYKSITKALINDNMQSSFAGLYIDGEFIGATSDIDHLNHSLNKILVDYRKDYDKETTTEFANNVEIKSGNFSESDIMSVDEIMALANGKFSISLSTDMVYTREVKFETVYEYDETKDSSYREVKTEGKNGTEKVVYRTTFVDGTQTDAVETKTIPLEKTINKVVVRGGSAEQYENSTATGSFIWPVPYTREISSYYEWRWGTMHWGIDIASSGIYGQDIVASDSGVVVQAGDFYDGYGYCVIIDHGNGFSTVYAHCSSLAVYEGQQVSQGQTIGYVGSTGYSTGPHLHFEVREGENKLDPLNFVS